ncbi:MAG TPA: hypothetical protein VFO10_02685, partial [Oligoflexus sp.]|uniref:hypothetical protein n=1 Tax=Oligoflexus sp. TaxID=1971216 RepID=UPI002D7F7D41
MTRFIKIIIISLSTALITGCGKDSNSSGSTAGPAVRIGSMDISDASQLFVTGPNSTGLFLAGETELKPLTLYKYVGEGKVVKEVSYQDEAGNPVTVTTYPTEVSSPDSRLVFFKFSDEAT